MGKSEIAAVSATYTIANKKVASALGKKPDTRADPVWIWMKSSLTFLRR